VNVKKRRGRRASGRQLVIAYHTGRRRLSDAALDRILHLSWRKAEASLDLLDLLDRYGNELFEYHGLGYADIRWIIHALQLTERDVVYDLGAGYGRFVIYGALVSPAKFKGIEIVRERAAHIARARARLRLRNACVAAENAAAADFTDGTKFYLFSPFFTPTLRAVARKLETCAAKRPITVVAIYHAATYFSRQRWLKKVTASLAKHFDDVPVGLEVFVSRAQHDKTSRAAA
jgi:predicted RNA methylase